MTRESLTIFNSAARTLRLGDPGAHDNLHIGRTLRDFYRELPGEYPLQDFPELLQRLDSAERRSGGN